MTIHSAEHPIPIVIEETQGLSRTREPVTVGIPFPQGGLQDLSPLLLFDPAEQRVPFQAQTLACWPDGSIKWVLLDFQVALAANTTAQYCLRKTATPQEKIASASEITLKTADDGHSLCIDTGNAVFTLNSEVFKPFESVTIDGVELLDPAQTGMLLQDELGQRYVHVIHTISKETEGPLRATIKIEGVVSASSDAPLFAEFFARLHVYAGHSVSKMEYTIRNPRAAEHQGGLWDLGDPGSIYVDDLALRLAMRSDTPVKIDWTTRPDRQFTRAEAERLEIYQDSSGGENWQSSNHVNRFGEVKHRFRGYQVHGPDMLEEGWRATPMLALQNGRHQIAATLCGFWENFPKSLEADKNALILRLFPQQYHDQFELQGGEQKTHALFFCFASCIEKSVSLENSQLQWVHTPLIPHATPEWYAYTSVFDYLIPYSEDPRQDVIELIGTAIEGENTFVQRREIIDEYGWRHFGELYADHERIFYTGKKEYPVSHYNNQYDGVMGLLIQYARSGNTAWFQLAHALARHVIDIDMYHTEQDKPNYNGGLFWHTDHYSDAATATHRGYSKQTMIEKGLSFYGGGPSSEHDYSTGLLYHYYLTGEIASKEALIGLAEWVVNMDDGAQTRYKFLNTRPTGFASSTASADFSYHGPGRGAGYSINTLLDAYVLTGEVCYREKAEQLIQRCIHPADTIAERHLEDAEMRWSYTIFLQVLGRYLDLKIHWNELDDMYCYARASLLHYAAWMKDHEVLFSTIYEQLEFPTETWPAHDLRKCNVFLFAAKHAREPLRSEFLDKAEFFFENPLEDVFSFETRTLTRPLVLLMTNSGMHAYFHHYVQEEIAPTIECPQDFGKPSLFKSQLYHVRKIQTVVRKLLNTLNALRDR